MCVVLKKSTFAAVLTVRNRDSQMVAFTVFGLQTGSFDPVWGTQYVALHLKLGPGPRVLSE